MCSATEDQLEPEELAELGPRELSYFIASFFSDVKILQQNVSPHFMYLVLGITEHLCCASIISALIALPPLASTPAGP